jgi:putative sigma-54 modulation protein
MDVRFHSVNFTADVKLLNFIQKKMNKLELYFDNVVNADAYLKVESSNSRDNKFVELKLSVPGKDLIVKKHSKTFEEAADISIGALKRSLLRYKEKVKSTM